MRAICLIVFTVYAPTNRGLAYARKVGLERLTTLGSIRIIDVRGELISDLVSLSASPALGINGEDLLCNYASKYARGRSWREAREDVLEYFGSLLVDRLRLDGKGAYRSALLELPSLCILARSDKYPVTEQSDVLFRSMPWERPLDARRFAVPLFYADFIRLRLEDMGLGRPQLVPLDGKVDVTAAMDRMFDGAIDIVLSGTTCRQYGLGIVAVLYRSDGVIVGNTSGRNLYKSRTNGEQQ